MNPSTAEEWYELEKKNPYKSPHMLVKAAWDAATQIEREACAQAVGKAPAKVIRGRASA